MGALRWRPVRLKASCSAGVLAGLAIAGDDEV